MRRFGEITQFTPIDSMGSFAQWGGQSVQISLCLYA